MQSNYTQEQQEDIKDRMEKGNEYLASIGLQVAVTIVPYLQDTQYTNPDGTLKSKEENLPESIPNPEDTEINPNA